MQDPENTGKRLPSTPKRHGGPRFAKAFTKILRDPTISPNAKCVMLIVKSYMSADGAAWPSRETIAGHLGTSLKPVKEALAELKEKRLITWTKGSEGKSNVYLLADEHYARYLAQKVKIPAVPHGTVPAVPTGTTSETQEKESPARVREVEPGKIIRLTCKPLHYRPRSATQRRQGAQ